MSQESMMESTARMSFGTFATDVSYTAPPPQLWRVGIPGPIPRLFYNERRPTLVEICVDRILDNIRDFEVESFPSSSQSFLPMISKRWRLRSGEGAEDEKVGRALKKKREFSTEFLMAQLLGIQALGKRRTNTETVPINEILYYCSTLQSPLHVYHRSMTPSSSFDLVTTLNMSYNGFLSDSNILSIRSLSHLAFLFTAGSNLTDDGVSRLAMSLNLPEGRTNDWTGTWRLRGWFLDGSGKITDKGVKSFSKWPMMNVLGLDRTSVTTAGLQIFRNQAPRYGAGWHINRSLAGPTAKLYQMIIPGEGPDKKLAHQEWSKLSTIYNEVWPKSLQVYLPTRSNREEPKPIFTLNVRGGPPASVDQPPDKKSNRVIWSSTPGAGALYAPSVDLNRDALAEPDEYDRTPFRPDPDRPYDGPSEERQNRYGRGVGKGGTWKRRATMVVKGHWSTVEMAVKNTLVREPPTLEDLKKPNQIVHVAESISSRRGSQWAEPSKNLFGPVKAGFLRPAVKMASLGLETLSGAATSSSSSPRSSLGSSLHRTTSARKRSWTDDDEIALPEDGARKRPSPFASQAKPPASAKKGFGLFRKL